METLSPRPGFSVPWSGQRSAAFVIHTTYVGTRPSRWAACRPAGNSQSRTCRSWRRSCGPCSFGTRRLPRVCRARQSTGAPRPSRCRTRNARNVRNSYTLKTPKTRIGTWWRNHRQSEAVSLREGVLRVLGLHFVWRASRTSDGKKNKVIGFFVDIPIIFFSLLISKWMVWWAKKKKKEKLTK